MVNNNNSCQLYPTFKAVELRAQKLKFLSIGVDRERFVQSKARDTRPAANLGANQVVLGGVVF